MYVSRAMLERKLGEPKTNGSFTLGEHTPLESASRQSGYALNSNSFLEVENMRNRSRFRIRGSADRSSGGIRLPRDSLAAVGSLRPNKLLLERRRRHLGPTSTLWSPSSVAGSSGPWVNSNASVADIGYLGTGGSYSSPAAINLTTPIIARSLIFGVPAGVPPPANHYYALTGSGITIGDGINPGVDHHRRRIHAGLRRQLHLQQPDRGRRPGPGTRCLRQLRQPVRLRGYINSYHYLTGANTFSSLTIDNAIGAHRPQLGLLQRHSELHQRGQRDHGERRRHCRRRPSSDDMTIGTITMSAAADSYIPLGYAIRGNNVIQIGAGGTSATGGGVANSAPTVIVNGPIQGPGGAAGQSDVLFSSSFTSGGRGTVILNAQSNYVGITAMNQILSPHGRHRHDGHRAAWGQQCPADDHGFGFGEANGNSGAPRSARLQPNGQLDLHLE